MLVVMDAHASQAQVRAVCEKVESLGYRAHPIPGVQRTAIGITDNQGLVVTVHNDPDHALSDGNQSLFPEQFAQLVDEVRQISDVLQRNASRASAPGNQPSDAH